MNMIGYSQAGQDKFVLEILGNGGTFLDVGCRLPKEINNTLLLEEHGWIGWSLDIENYTEEWKVRANPFIQADALTCTYDFIERKIIDYLSLDIEGEGTRYLALKRLIDLGFEFKIITIEHDAYRGYEQCEREPQRKLLKEQGYLLILPDVKIEGKEFEDWWINPKHFPDLLT